MIIVEV